MANNLTEILKRNREKLGFTQSEMAMKLGILQGRYSQYEAGGRKPKLDFYQKYKEVFKISLTDNIPNATKNNNKSDINSLPIIAVHVESFADGRIFSLGTLLRTRYGYINELRAFSDVLREKLFFLKRSVLDS